MKNTRFLKILGKLNNKRLHHMGVYLGSTVIAKLIPFFVLPLVTAVAGPEEYGRWALYNSLISFAAPLAGSSMISHIYSRYYKADEREMHDIMNHTLLLIALCCVLMLVVFVPLLLLGTVFSLPAQYLLLLPVFLLLQQTQDTAQTVMRFRNAPFLFAFSEIGTNVLNAAFYTSFILALGMKWEGFLFGNLLAVLVFAIFSLWYLHRHYDIPKPEWNAQTARSILKPALPMIPHLIGANLILMTDRLLIERMVSIEAVGVFAIGLMAANPLKMFVQSVMKVWGPWLSEQLSHIDEARKINIARSTLLAAAGLAAASLAIGVVGWVYIALFFDPRFRPALAVLPWAIGVFFIQGVYQMLSTHIVFSGHTKILAKTTLGVGVLNLFLSILFIDLFGMVGAAQATVLSFALQLILIFSYIQKTTPMPFFSFFRKA